jgi:hypothetical protein
MVWPNTWLSGKRVQNPERVNQPLVAQVRLRCVFDWPYAGQHVAVGQHNSFGIARSAGGEQDLQRCVAESPGTGPASSAGKCVSQSSKKI